MYFESKAQKVFKVINYVFLSLLALVMLLPFWYVLVVSLNTGGDFGRGGVFLWPRAFTLNNYRSALRDEKVVQALLISIFRTVMQILTGVVATSLLAYSLSVKSLPGRKGITFFFYFTTIFSGGLIPYYMLLRDIGLTQSIWLYVIPMIYNFFNTVLLRIAFDDIPTELREAALIDGAGNVLVLFKIYIPCALPTIATVALYIGVSAWNDWYTGIYYQLNRELLPIASLMEQYLTDSPGPREMAYLVVSIAPIIAVYPLLQKYYINGIMVGSVKG